ncbi:MAG: polymer-forming cytoskeletal protein [Anaerolineae bacterium]|nr:polymer-forming cytoskeletal protein [Anaerolineae bacterium]
MLRKIVYAVVLNLLMLMVALSTVAPSSALAAPVPQGGGGVHFGPYTLSSGDSLSGDLVVFGPVTVEEDAYLDGDLVVFSSATIEEGATLVGDLVVTGYAQIAGTVDGNVFSAGYVELEDTAYVDGDVSAIGTVEQAEDAVVGGSIVPIENFDEIEELKDLDRFDFDWEEPQIPSPVSEPFSVQVSRTPTWLRVLGQIARGFLNIIIMGLLALVILSIWPQQTQRVGRTIEEIPLTAFGVGLLTFLIAAIAFGVLMITICLSPFALVGMIIVGVGVLFGWVALGLVLGERLLRNIATQSQPTPVLSAVVGTVLLTLIMVMSQVFWPIRSILFFFLLPPAAGAVLLTRFGTRPYLTRGGGIVRAPGVARPSAPQPAPLVPTAPAPEPEDVAEWQSDGVETPELPEESPTPFDEGA